MILVSGAAGKTGLAVIEHLVAKEQPVRGLVRRPEQATQLRSCGAAEAIIGDMAGRETWERAAEGIRMIYHICPNVHPQELSIAETAIRTAQAAGVQRFVYHSVLHPQIEEMPHHWQKMRVEERLFESGLSYTIVQPAAYMQNILANWERIANEGVYAVPYAVQAQMSMVDLRDVAEVVAKVMVEEGHEGAVYELCGGEILSQQEIAAIIGLHLGREVKAEAVALDKWEQQARASGLNGYILNTLLKMFQYYDQYGFWGNGNVLGSLLGRSPTSFKHFLERVKSERR